MIRQFGPLAVMVAVAGHAMDAKAALQAIYSTESCGRGSTHIVVVDNTGKVLESWRGDVAAGMSVPLKEFKITLEHKVEKYSSRDGKELPKLSDKVTGKRLVLFLRKGGPRMTGNNATPTAGWGGGNWSGSFQPSTVWVENGQAFYLDYYLTTTGPLVMTYLSTEAELKTKIEQIDKKFRDLFAEARAIPKRTLRTPKLVTLLEDYPGFADEVIAELGTYGSDALPALQAIVKERKTADSDKVAAYTLMAKIGEPARDDLMAMCKIQLGNFKEWSLRVALSGLEYSLSEPWYRFLKAGLSNPDAFRGITDAQRDTLRELRTLWIEHPVLSKLDEKGDQVPDRIDRILKR